MNYWIERARWSVVEIGWLGVGELRLGLCLMCVLRCRGGRVGMAWWDEVC